MLGKPTDNILQKKQALAGIVVQTSKEYFLFGGGALTLKRRDTCRQENAYIGGRISLNGELAASSSDE